MPFSNHDVVPDSPINNFATFNPLDKGSSVIIVNGNLVLSTTTNLANFTITRSNMVFPKTGIYYFECYFLSSTNGGWFGIDNGYGKISGNQNGYNNGTASISRDGNGKFNFGVDGILIGSQTHTSGTVIPVVWDADTNTIYTNQGVPSSSSLSSYTYSKVVSAVTGDFYPIAGPRHSTTDFVFNFGQDPTFGGFKSPTTTYPDANGLGQFHYQPPAGAMALCTQNLPEGPIKLSQDQTPSDNFKAVTWTGQVDSTIYQRTGASSAELTLGMAADLVWVKCRDAVYHHVLIDSVRGAGKVLYSSQSNAEWDGVANNNRIVSGFNSEGITLESDATKGWNGDFPNQKMVAWCWRAAGAPADGGSSVAGSARIINEDGTQADTTCAALATAASASITPSKVSANRQNGFSIVKYSGTAVDGHTCPHGLSSPVEVCIVKNISYGPTAFLVYHKDLTNDYNLQLSSNEKQRHTSTIYGGEVGTPDENYIRFLKGSGVNGVPVYSNVNNSGDTYIAYCWHSVAGYSKFGSYVGNGSADGPFVYTGFRPAFVMVKRTDASQSWAISDNNRTTSYNPANGVLLPNDSAAEQNLIWHDFLSNGFKARQTYTGLNASGGTYIYMAFAEQPFSGPSNAR